MTRTFTANEITELNYTGFVGSLLKPGQAILDSLTAEKCHVLHMLVGLVGESQELYGYNSHKNFIEELGDVEFYLTGLELNNELLGTSGAVGKGAQILDCHVPRYYTNYEYLNEIRKHAHNALELGVKKWILYNKDISTEALKEELRAIHRLLRGLYQLEHRERAAILEANKAKLEKRYEKGYSDKAAQERADKKGEE